MLPTFSPCRALPLWLCYVFFVAFAVSAPTPSQSLINITITAPQGTNDHGDPHLLCTPSQWSDVATFFLANYVAHAATVQFVPGESTLSTALAVVWALFFPTSGTMRGLKAIWQRAVFSGSALDKASRAGALCMVVRSHEWKPRSGDIVEGLRPAPQRDLLWEVCHSTPTPTIPGEEKPGTQNPSLNIPKAQTVNEEQRVTANKEKLPGPQIAEPYLGLPLLDIDYDTGLHGAVFSPAGHGILSTGCKIHGRCSLPPGYVLARLPSGTPVSDLDGNVRSHKRQDGISKYKTGGLRSLYKSARDTVARNVIHTMFPADMTAIEDDFRDRRIPVAFRKDINDFRRVARWQRKYKDKPSTVDMDLSSSYSFSQAAVAMFQVVFASVTLYRTRGDQIQRYGFAAFGLTVAPYLTMSIINLISAFVTPNYPTLYMVKSETMKEAIAHGAKIEGMVGALIPVQSDNQDVMRGAFQTEGDKRFYIHRQRAVPNDQGKSETLEERVEIRLHFWHPRRRPTLETARLLLPSCSNFKRPGRQNDFTTDMSFSTFIACSIAIGSIPIIINGCLSHFQTGQSTLAQRVWIMIWLVFGVVIGPITTMADFAGSHLRTGNGDLANSFVLVCAIGFAILYAPPAIGGFVVVAEMIKQYGTCVQIY
ncbi:hypothetical protein MMC11_004745 [Xylographa trunciseda]|nr:hypothetical protein [Xylographa trunciseda]